MLRHDKQVIRMKEREKEEMMRRKEMKMKGTTRMGG